MANDTFTIYLSNKLTFSLTLLIHALSLLITAYLFKACDLASQFTQVIQSINFKIIHKHKILKPKQTTAYKCKLFQKAVKFAKYVNKLTKTGM